MKKNKIRGILLFVFLIICAGIGTTANAESIINQDGIENSVYVDENGSVAVAELKLMSQNEDGISLYGQYLSYGTAAIKNLGGGQVNFNGDTVCYRESDVVVVSLTLQRLVGGNWRSYATITDTRYNARNAAVGTTVAVTKGYYYRVKGVHTAQKGSIVDSTTTYTEGIYVG